MTGSAPREGRTWPGYVFGGRLRTSTAVLIIAFFAVWWLYETYEPGAATPEQVPATEVVPPGFVPDPNYTWAPRTDVQRRSESETTTPTTTSTTPTSSTPTTPTSPAPSPEPGVPPAPSGPSSAAPRSSAPPAPTATPHSTQPSPAPPAPAAGGAGAPVPPAQ